MKIRYKGFTLLEILLVITLIGILIGIVLVSINPNQQLAQARNLVRKSDITNLYDALEVYRVRNSVNTLPTIDRMYKEVCDTGTKTSSESLPNNTYCNGKLDLRALVPTYISSIPKDSQAKDVGSTGYEIAKDNQNQISIRAIKAELAETIAVNVPKDILYAKAGGFPSLDLNFAGNKSLIDNVSGKNLITFARNSPATYVGSDKLIKTAAVNEPRFDHNPVTGESLGLLVEEPRTNLVIRSVFQFTSTPGYPTGWTGFNPGRVVKSLSSAPDGTDAAIVGKVFGNSGGFRPSSSISLSTSTNYTLTWYARKPTDSELALFLSYYPTNDSTMQSYTKGSYIRYDNTVAGLGASSIFTLTDNWSRFSFSFNSGTSTQIQPNFTTITQGGSYASNDLFVIAGVQLEAGSFPTSYIPTTGDVATRQADNVLITGTNFSNWYNQSEGSVFTTFRGGRESQQNGYGRIISPTGAAALLSTNNSANSLSVWFGGSAINFNGINNVDYWNTGNTATVTYNNTNTTIIKGNQSATGNIKPTDAGTINSWQLGSNNFARTNMLNGTLSRVTYWPTRLSNTVLQNITQ